MARSSIAISKAMYLCLPLRDDPLPGRGSMSPTSSSMAVINPPALRARARRQPLPRYAYVATV